MAFGYAKKGGKLAQAENKTKVEETKAKAEEKKDDKKGAQKGKGKK